VDVEKQWVKHVWSFLGAEMMDSFTDNSFVLGLSSVVNFKGIVGFLKFLQKWSKLDCCHSAFAFQS
jgi:hypothetical protein